MTLANPLELLQHARANGYALGSFNVIELAHAEAIVRAAEVGRSPVILQISENAVRYHLGQLAPIGRGCYELARAATVPVGLHLDHATGWELCAVALEIGFGSVMLDGSALPYAQNIQVTAEAAERVHAAGATIEAELGRVGGKEESSRSPENDDKTDPDEATRFVEATGVDTLAVAVGTAHQMVQTTARLDLKLITRLRRAVEVPLVLHGSSGVGDQDMLAAIQRGIVKVNIATLLNIEYTTAIRVYLASDPNVVDPRKYLVAARAAMTNVVQGRLQLLGSAGRSPISDPS